MRPDFVTPEYTPNLHALARDGVVFQNHHPVYLSATEVNGVALATGAYPRKSGVIANREFRPALESAKPVGTVAIAVLAGDQERVQTFRFAGGREDVKSQAAQAALNMLRLMLLP